MAGGEQHIKKREGPGTIRSGLKKFLEKGFDWIALVVITIVILLTLVFF